MSSNPADTFYSRFEQLVQFGQRANLHKISELSESLLLGQVKSGKMSFTELSGPIVIFRPEELIHYSTYIDPTLFGKFSHFIDLAIRIQELSRHLDGVLKDYTSGKLNSGEMAEYESTLSESVSLIQTSFSIFSLELINLSLAMNITESNISHKRSMRMHEVARDRASTKGLWKIGNDHAGDMAPLAKNYNLLDKDQFNADYSLFWQRAETLAAIKTTASKDWGSYTWWKSVPNGVKAIRDIISQHAGAGTNPKLVLTSIKNQATGDLGRKSKNRDQKTTDFYTVLSAMNVSDKSSLQHVITTVSTLL